MNSLPGYYVEIDTKKRTIEVLQVPSRFNFKAMLREQLGLWVEQVTNVHGDKIAVVWDNSIKENYQTLKSPNTSEEMFGKVFLIKKSGDAYIIASKEIAEEVKNLWEQTLFSLKDQDKEEEQDKNK
ncbi:hypothetical protein [Bacillus toyonensis]